MVDAPKYIWLDGKIVDYEKASVHILTHSLQYGSGIFEGIRAYETKDNSAVFRLDDHVKRFINSARICNIKLGYTHEQLFSAILNIVKKNMLKRCYIRPFAFYNDPNIGLSTEGKKISVAVIAVPFGNYFGDKDKGITCKISSMRRINSPSLARAASNAVRALKAWPRCR